jgi:hypothetical protein
VKTAGYYIDQLLTFIHAVAQYKDQTMRTNLKSSLETKAIPLIDYCALKHNDKTRKHPGLELMTSKIGHMRSAK